jgi:hypothetical protein
VRNFAVHPSSAPTPAACDDDDDGGSGGVGPWRTLYRMHHEVGIKRSRVEG